MRSRASLWAILPGLSSVTLSMGLMLSPGSASAQNLTPDPYQPFTRMYIPYSRPTFNPERSLSRAMNSSPLATTPQDDGFGLFGELMSRDKITSRGPLRGMPYFSSSRIPRSSGEGNYSPNENADREFYKDQKRRFDLYFKAVSETDPKKKADLMREYRKISQDSMGKEESERGKSAAGGLGNSTARRTAPGRRASTENTSTSARTSAGTRSTATRAATAAQPPNSAANASPTPTTTQTPTSPRAATGSTAARSTPNAITPSSSPPSRSTPSSTTAAPRTSAPTRPTTPASPTTPAATSSPFDSLIPSLPLPGEPRTGLPTARTPRVPERTGTSTPPTRRRAPTPTEILERSQRSSPPR